MKNYFSSDLHLGHANVIKYDGRPFKDVKEMDEALILNHNNTVDPEDNWYFLGDLSFNKDKTEEYLQRLNGNKFFIRGNHDYSETVALYKKYGTYLGRMEEIKIDGKDITICHYPLDVWNKSHHKSLHLFGHCHHSLPDDPNKLRLDVGINGKGYGYRPQSFETLLKLIDKKEFKAVDHHKGRK